MKITEIINNKLDIDDRKTITDIMKGDEVAISIYETYNFIKQISKNFNIPLENVYPPSLLKELLSEIRDQLILANKIFNDDEQAIKILKYLISIIRSALTKLNVSEKIKQ